MSRHEPATQAPAASARAQLRTAAQTMLVLYAVWFALAGASAPWLGLLLAAAGAAAGTWLAPGDDYRWRPLRLLGFIGYFLRESLLGGIDVARRALAPKCRVDPVFLAYRVGLPAGAPRTLLVAVVSLLPGTLSVDVDASGALRIHALAADAGAALPALERRVAALFGIPVDPGTAMPTPARRPPP